MNTTSFLPQLHSNGLIEAFLNVYTILMIYLCMFVTNCKGEQSFSKLRLILNLEIPCACAFEEWYDAYALWKHGYCPWWWEWWQGCWFSSCNQVVVANKQARWKQWLTWGQVEKNKAPKRSQVTKRRQGDNTRKRRQAVWLWGWGAQHGGNWREYENMSMLMTRTS